MTMRRYVSSFASLVLVFAISAGNAHAQGGHTLQGRVSLPNGTQPVSPVKVTLTFNGMRVYETFTDLSGRFLFSSLRSGNYTLIAEGDGQTFETTSTSAEISGLGRAPLNFTQNIALKPIKGKAVQPAAAVSADAVDPAVSPKARESYNKGIKSAENNKSEEAIKRFTEAIETAPDFYAAHLALGDQLLKLGRIEEAGAAYKKALDLKPDRPEPIGGMGAVLVQQRKYSDALPMLRRVVEMGKQSSATHLYLGLAETMTGDYPNAEANLKRAFEMNPSPITRIYLANLYELKGEPAGAIDQLQAFLKENPNAPQAPQIRAAIDKLRKKLSGKK
jgi:Tfp pilus assembly protein PilF